MRTLRTVGPGRFGRDGEAGAVGLAGRETIKDVARTAWVSAVGCEELGRLGLLDTSGCCELCHTAEKYMKGRSFLGPCHATLPDGRTASVCCAGKKRLIRRAGS